MQPPLIVILGPTATGKTALSLRLAPLLRAEVVSADSAMVYRHLDVGTAKPSPEERARVPHHLIDVITPDRRFSVAEFQRLARAAIDDIVARGRVPLLVGGTGLYIRALVEDYPLDRVPAPPDPVLRRRLLAEAERLGPEHLHRRLGALDPEAAARIHPHDLKRVIRALEVLAHGGRPSARPASAGGGRPSPWRVLKLGLTCARPELYRRIDERARQQFAGGFVDEVRRVLAMGYRPEDPGLQILGYRHVVAHVQGRLSLDQALALTQRDTRRYAKRQLTWFRRERGVRWIDVEGRTPEELAALLLPLLEDFTSRP